jgi:CxxC motif-containing protein (DUF1111 family)
MRSPRTEIVRMLPLVLAMSCAEPATRSGSEAPHVEARRVGVDRSDFPLVKATPEESERFKRGDELFEVSLREVDGLGPLYVRPSCVSCHQDDARGPGLVTKVGFVSLELGEPSGEPTELLPHGNTVRPYRTAGAKLALLAPEDTRVRVSHRLPPAVFGRGYLDAVLDSEIERLEKLAQERDNGIRGRIHRVSYASESNSRPGYPSHEKGQTGLIGRFGMKARIATLDEFAADALQGDMGITTPLRPFEPSNPDGLTEDEKPGVDLDRDSVELLADYVRLLELPEREAGTERGRELFREALCGDCHVPSLKTRLDYPVRSLAGIDAPVFTDFLLHDMGTELADGVREGDATGREFRTAPLIGLRFLVAFMHDGRAKTVEQAVLAHRGEGSEANGSVQRFSALSESDRAELLRFVESL